MNLQTKLNALLQRIFQAQAREVMTRVRLGGDAPDLSAWIKATADACLPVMTQMWQQGIVQSGGKLAARRGEAVMPRVARPSEATAVAVANDMRTIRPGNDAIFGERRAKMILRGKRHLVVKAAGRGRASDLDLSFDLFNPRVLQAVQAATFTFCQETLDTATKELQAALDELRAKMAEGLERGAAVETLARKVRTIFADPYRAFRIATTEGSRAIHGGQMLLAREAGVLRHSWLASSDACDACLELDGKSVEIGQPFTVLEMGGPYAVVLHPPLHPFCFCSTTEEL